MSTFTEKITLTNVKDEARVEAGIMQKARTITVDARVDTGAWFLVLNEDTRAALGLKTVGTETATLADGTGTKPTIRCIRVGWGGGGVAGEDGFRHCDNLQTRRECLTPQRG
jgi:predicted aspartyl protease